MNALLILFFGMVLYTLNLEEVKLLIDSQTEFYNGWISLRFNTTWQIEGLSILSQEIPPI